MSSSSTVPRLPGADLDVRKVEDGVALVDPENSSAYLWAASDDVCEVGTTRLE